MPEIVSYVIKKLKFARRAEVEISLINEAVGCFTINDNTIDAERPFSFVICKYVLTAY